MKLRTLLVLSACAFALQAWGQTFPSKPIRLLVGYPPGGSAAFLTRLVAEEMSRDLGVAVTPDNRPGAGGNIAAEIASKAPADGYTVLNGNNHAINKALYKNPGYKDGDFVPITKVAAGPTVIVVNNNLPVSNLRELIAHAKANPGKLFNAGAGYGSAPHPPPTLFATGAGGKITPGPVKSGGAAAHKPCARQTQQRH